MSAHVPHVSACFADPRSMKSALVWQMSAQSSSNRPAVIEYDRPLRVYPPFVSTAALFMYKPNDTLDNCVCILSSVRDDP